MGLFGYSTIIGDDEHKIWRGYEWHEWIEN